MTGVRPMESPQWRVLNLLSHMLDHALRVVLVDDERAELEAVIERIGELGEAIAAYQQGLELDDDLPF